MNSTYTYTRYLAAKKSVDDRALNKDVFECLRSQLSPSQSLKIMEIGAGLGTMVARLIEWKLLVNADYTLLDVDAQLLVDSREWLRQWADAQGMRVHNQSHRLDLESDSGTVRVRFLEAELGHYLEQGQKTPADLLICNAFLDLVDVASTLPGLFRLISPGGLYWFTINFDGQTLFQPGHPDDELLMGAYHRGMDERVRYGRPAGESRAGRHMFHHLRAAGASPLASGSSDWVVHPLRDGGYYGDEAFFLQHILDTVEQGLRPRPDVDSEALDAWLATRRSQLAQGELLYIAHQLDFVGRT